MKTLLTLSLLLLFSATAQAFDHSHGILNAVLKTYVNKEGMVNYKSLRGNRAGLDSYLEATAAVSKSEYDGWSEKQKLAFLINIYNAETLQLIIDNYPTTSIKKIGSILRGPWDQKVVELFGETTTLNHVEHEILRKDFSEPRIHFAIVCAAMGCPPLRAEAFTPDQVDTQMNEQAKIFMAQSEKNRIEGDTLYLSQIFKWFAGDFIKPGLSIDQYVDPFIEGTSSGKSVKYTDYDWSLNQQ